MQHPLLATKPLAARSTWPLLCVVFALVSACGGASTEQQSETTVVARRDDGPREEPRDGVAISGLMGTVSSESVRDTLQMRQDRFLACFTDRLEHVRVLGGTIELAFRVGVDGSVLWVYPKRSTIGDRETERCILGVAGSVHFRRPNGGEAEFSWPFEVAPPDDVRPPLSWTPDRVAPLLAQHLDLGSRCRPAGSDMTYSITAYVAPGGAVLAAGGAPSGPGGIESVDCVLDMVRGWPMPNPGSYPAKITFDVQ